MKEVILFEHNEIGYQKLIETLIDHKCATVDHATGTGKTPIQLKFLAMNKDKKYLLLTPRYPIIEQFFKTCYKIGITPEDINVDAMIYRSLLDLDMDELYNKYDGIIFDEYHRIGAKETYKKVKQLKRKLEESDDDKKFIGFTATPIRYLDNERNMTEEIFDGNVASKLSLSEAMIRGLLPVPMYINSKIACRGEYQRIRRKVNKLAPSKEKERLDKRMAKVSGQINNGSMDNKQMISKYIKEKNGKYIVFCNTIKNLEQYYKEADSWFSGIGKVKKYKVHSGQERIENQEKLDEFNEQKEGLSILFCVDILNEGVHVEDIDGVILLRRTTSPIIYFQQIGRALSFAGRERQIKIFDLVNNFGNHNAIDLVYEEYQEEIRRLMKLHPENKEYYEEQLKKFVIMDETRDILKELDEINKQVTPEKIRYSRIEYAIDILENKFKQQKEDMNLFDDEELKEAYVVISRYAIYIDNDQFKRLLELDIVLPEDISMSWEERQELLAGCKSLYEKQQKENEIYSQDIIKFIEKTGKRPDEKSDDEKERMLAQKYLICILELEDKEKKEIENVLKNNQLELNFYEKIFLDKEIDGEELEQLISVGNDFVKRGEQLPGYLYTAINTVVIKYNVNRIDELFKILDDNEKIIEQKIEKAEEERHSKLANIVQYLESNIESSREELRKSGIFDEIRTLRPRDRAYIKNKYKIFKKKQYKGIFSEADNTEMDRFCRKAKTMTLEDIGDYTTKIEKDKEAYATILAIIGFMRKNNGKIPDKNSDDETERKMAIKLEELMAEGNITSMFCEIGQDTKSLWHSPKDIIYDIALDGFKQKEIKMVILRNIEFWNRNGRRPLKNSQDEEEAILAAEYEKKCVPYLDQENIQVLNKVFNSRRSLQRTCQQYINNLKATSGEGR